MQKKKKVNKVKKITAEVVTAIPLTLQQETKIRNWIVKTLGREVEIKVRVETGIIAGLFVRANDWIFDGTFIHHLKRLRETFVRG